MLLVNCPKTGNRTETTASGQADSMWLFFQDKNDLTRVPDGRKEPAKCGACGKVAFFYECTLDKSFNLYYVLPLWKEKKNVMQCGECLAAYNLEDFDAGKMTGAGAAAQGTAGQGAAGAAKGAGASGASGSATGSAAGSASGANGTANSGTGSAGAGSGSTSSGTSGAGNGSTSGSAKTSEQAQSGASFVDFAKGFIKMTAELGSKTKGIMGKLDQMTFNMLIDNLKSNDQQVVFDTIGQLEKEKRPISIAPMYFVWKNHPNKNIRERAAKALANMTDMNKIEKLTEGKQIEEAIKVLIEEFGHFKS